MNFRLQVQLSEVKSSDNRWYCSQFHRRPIDDAETLLIYYIQSGGAEDFAWRFTEAMGPQNRWFCSEHFGREITDPKTLWDYYMEHAQFRGIENSTYACDDSLSEIDMTC